MPTSPIRSIAAAAAVAVGSFTFLMAPAGAQACYPPTAGCVTVGSVVTTGPTLTLATLIVTRGQRVSVTVTGFRAGTTGIFTIKSVEQQIGSFKMPASGGAKTSITIPTDISLGDHTVFARGTGLNGAPDSASQAVVVVAATGSGSGSNGGTLARTGMVVVPTALVGVGLVLGGLALKRSGKRGKASSTV